MSFGPILRRLRTESGMSLKRLAPALRVDYSYLSKLENGEVRPSEGLVARVATYFRYDRDTLLLSAGRIPPEILKALQERPDDAIAFLREHFGTRAE